VAGPVLVLSQPAIFTLELTSACNNRCALCSNRYADSRGHFSLPAADWERWLEAFGPEAVRIRLSGGEPTLHPEFDRILAAAASYDAYVSVFTNGRWPDPPGLLGQLREHSNLLGLLVSIHGAQARTHDVFTGQPGSFTQTLRNVQLARDHGITVALCTVLTRSSADEIEVIAEMGQALGVQHLAFNRYLGPPRDGVEVTPTEMVGVVARLEALIDAGHPVRYGECVPQCLALNSSRGCLAGVAEVSIDPWGNIKPCHHAQTVIGSLQKQSLAELWHSPLMERWRAFVPTACATCAALTVCHGGCRISRTKDGNRVDPLQRRPLQSYVPPSSTRELPAEGRPALRGRLRAEPFGYVVLGRGAVVPVRHAARPLLEACDGNRTCAELAQRFGQDGPELVADLCSEGLVDMM